MVTVYVSKQNPYPVSAVKIKKFIQNFFQKEGIVSDSFVSVALVGKEKMKSLAKKYYPTDNKVHNVFSFVESESVGFVNPKGVGINLGEIVICYPVAVTEASKEGILVEERVLELLGHAGEHLLGRHHK
ncbi:rRNA maturation RNAse YbeY [Candidatus Microgenomates bacterium]|nr:rRNA maturation RNAse YbeY [Candidatus Microgenomates bacterium]